MPNERLEFDVSEEIRKAIDRATSELDSQAIEGEAIDPEAPDTPPAPEGESDDGP